MSTHPTIIDLFYTAIAVMRNVTALLIFIFFCLCLGYPVYKDWQLEKEMRQAMKAALMPDFPTQGYNFPFKMTGANTYPTSEITLTLNDLTSDQLTTAQLVQINKIINTTACRNLEIFDHNSPTSNRIRAKIYKEDKVSLKMTVKDKDGHVIDQYNQLLADCAWSKAAIDYARDFYSFR